MDYIVFVNCALETTSLSYRVMRYTAVMKIDKKMKGLNANRPRESYLLTLFPQGAQADSIEAY